MAHAASADASLAQQEGKLTATIPEPSDLISSISISIHHTRLSASRVRKTEARALAYYLGYHGRRCLDIKMGVTSMCLHP